MLAHILPVLVKHTCCMQTLGKKVVDSSDDDEPAESDSMSMEEYEAPTPSPAVVARQVGSSSTVDTC